jgi:hypothetical protein
MTDLLIKVPESECLPILDRGKALTIAAQLKPWLNLLDDMVNYAAALIPRLYGSSDKSIGDAVVLTVLLRQIVAMFDAIEVLMSQGAVHAARLQLRAMLEAWLYLEWVLLGEKDKKARYYYVFNLRRQQMWALRLQPDSDEGKKFREIMAKENLPLDETLGQQATANLAAIAGALQEPENAAVQAEFDAWMKKHRSLSWYSPFGVKNLRQVAVQVAKEPIYAMVYGATSDVMHASSYEDHIRIAEGKLTVDSVRHPRKFREVFRFSTIIAMNMFHTLLKAYRPGELSLLGRKYEEKWRGAFLHPPELQINTEESLL